MSVNHMTAPSNSFYRVTFMTGCLFSDENYREQPPSHESSREHPLVNSSTEGEQNEQDRRHSVRRQLLRQPGEGDFPRRARPVRP